MKYFHKAETISKKQTLKKEMFPPSLKKRDIIKHARALKTANIQETVAFIKHVFTLKSPVIISSVYFLQTDNGPSWRG